jgi:hypothetical protein
MGPDVIIRGTVHICLGLILQMIKVTIMNYDPFSIVYSFDDIGFLNKVNMKSHPDRQRQNTELAFCTICYHHQETLTCLIAYSPVRRFNARHRMNESVNGILPNKDLHAQVSSKGNFIAQVQILDILRESSMHASRGVC